jgi:hypothetical protein
LPCGALLSTGTSLPLSFRVSVSCLKCKITLSTRKLFDLRVVTLYEWRRHELLMLRILRKPVFISHMFMSRHQTAGQSNYIRVANKSFESVKVQVFRININRPELHSRGNWEQTKFGECLLPCSSESFVFLSAV